MCHAPGPRMRHMTRVEAEILVLLRRARVIAIVGASPRPERHSNQVTAYLAAVGFDVLPVRPDRAEVAGRPSYATLLDIAGPIDIVVIFRRPDAVQDAIDGASAKRAEAIWLPPGVWTPLAEQQASALGLVVVRDRCI